MASLARVYRRGRMIEIRVELGAHSHPVHVGHGALDLLPELVGPARGRTVIVADERVWALHGRRARRSFSRLGAKRHLLLKSGERVKSRATLARLHDFFLATGLARDGLVIAFGGGVVGDVTGFAAATYMRGVAWLPVPTTLLAMTDSAIGGKVAVNHPRAKNLIGAFHQPRAVLVDPRLLDSLPPRQAQSGAYELLKAGLIADRSLFDSMRRVPRQLVHWSRAEREQAIAAGVRVKTRIVEADEKESGKRKLLNLGHTLGHALEAVTSYRRFTHGEAVGWGIIGASWIARSRKLLSQTGFEAIAAAVDHLGRRPAITDLKTNQVLARLAHDKKAERGRVPFILPRSPGRVSIVRDVSSAEIRAALRAMAARETRLD